MGRLRYSNLAKKENSKSWVNSRWIWFIGEGDKDVSFQITSEPSFSWGIGTDGCEGEVSINFWFLLNFYFTFTRVFPEWVYSKEYNQFADEEASAVRNKKNNQEREAGYLEDKPSGYSKEYYDIQNKNKNLKGRKRTKNKGWIRTGKRDLSLRFHNYSMWWNVWRDDDEWSSDTPRWRSGSLDFVRLLKGKSKVEKTLINTVFDEVEMPEGKYLCRISQNKYIRRYSRWWSKSWNRFEFEFGYNDNDEWIKTPIISWGKGENSWDCGMDGTYSISLGSGIKSLDEAKDKVVEIKLKDRERYGKIDFSKVNGIESGYVKANLIGQF